MTEEIQAQRQQLENNVSNAQRLLGAVEKRVMIAQGRYEEANSLQQGIAAEYRDAVMALANFEAEHAPKEPDPDEDLGGDD